MGSGFSRGQRETVVAVAPTNAGYVLSHQINYITLCVILKGPCQNAMRRILASFVQESDLQNELKRNESYLSKHIHKNDLKIIFPTTNTNVEYSILDFTNMYAIIRNCKVFKQGIESVSKSNYNLKWGQRPNRNDPTILAAIETLRISRNFDAHLPSAEVSDRIFNATWEDIETSLKNIEKHLGCKDREFRKEMVEIKERYKKKLDVQQHATALHAEREKLKKKEEDIQKIWNSISGADEKYITDYCETEKIIQTTAFEDAKRKLEKYKYVLITGKSKSGKSVLVHHLMKWLLYDADTECPLLCKIVRTPEALKDCMGENTVVLAEDIFHDIFEETRGRSASFWLKIGPWIESLIKSSNKKGMYFIFSTNEKHFDEARRTHYSSGLLNEKHVINLSSETYALSLDEKESMLKEFLGCSFELSEEEKKILRNCDPPLGFPVTAIAYARDDTYRKQGIHFFENSVEFLLREVESMFKHDKNKFSLFLLIYRQRDNPTALDKSYGRFFKKSSLENYTPYSLQYLKRAAKETSEVYIDEFKEMHFQFSHNAIRDALEHYLLKNNFDIALEVMDISALLSKLLVTFTFHDLNIMSDESKLGLLTKRIMEELKNSQLCIVVQCEIWRDPGNKKLLSIFKKNLSLDLFKLKERHWGFMYWVGYNQCYRLMKKCINYLQAEHSSDDSPDNKLLETCLSEGICGLCHHGDKKTVKIIKAYIRQSMINYKNSQTLECALEIAASNFHDKVVQLLLKEKAIINVSNWFPGISILWSILHKAVYRGDRELCSSAFLRAIITEEEISKQGNVVNVSRDKKAHEVIILSHISSLNEWEDIFLALARHLKRPLHVLESFQNSAPNFSFDCTKPDGKNALHLLMLSFAETVKLYAFDRDHPELIGLRKNVCDTIDFLSNTSCRLDARDKEGDTAIKIHIHGGPHREIISKFVDCGFNIQQKFGQTNILGELLKTEHSDECLLACVEYVLEKDVDIVTNLFVHSPLYYAILRERCKIFDHLLSYCKSKFTEDSCLKCLRHLIRSDIDDEIKTKLFEVLQRYHKIDFIDGKNVLSYIIKESSCSCMFIKSAVESLAISLPDKDKPNDFPLHHWAKLDKEANVMIDLLHLRTECIPIDVVNAQGETPFMIYLRFSNLNTEVIDAIMELKPDISQIDFSGKTMLMHILSNRFVKFDIAEKLLLTKGLEIAKLDERGRSHIHYILESNLSDDNACILCNYILQREIFSDIVGVDDQLSILQTNKKKEKTMGYILKKIFERPPCTLYELLQYLLEISLLKTSIIENIKMKHPPGLTFKKNIFHTILKEEYQEPEDSLFLFKIFLDMGFDINQEDDKRFTPLQRACSKTTSSLLIKHLIKRGAKTRDIADNKNIVRLCLESSRSDDEVVSILKVIHDLDDSERHRSFILDEKDTAMRTPIMIAFECKYVRTNTIRWLLGKPIDLSGQDAFGKTIFHHCVASNMFDEEVAEVLSCIVDSGRLHGNLHCKDSSGQTPLHYCSKHATRSRILSMIWLIEREADIMSLDMIGNTPLINVLVNLTNNKDIFAQCEKACRTTILLLSYEQLGSTLPDSITIYTENIHITMKNLFDSYPNGSYHNCLSRYIEKLISMWEPKNIDFEGSPPSIFENRIPEWVLIRDIICFISKSEFQSSGEEIDSSDFTFASDFITQ